MTHQPHGLPLRWTRAEGIWLAKGPDSDYTLFRKPDCRGQCWVLQTTRLSSVASIGSFRTLRAAKAVAEAIERG